MLYTLGALFKDDVTYWAKIWICLSIVYLRGFTKMDGADVTKRYLKEQLDVLGIKNLTEKELDKYTEGVDAL